MNQENKRSDLMIVSFPKSVNHFNQVLWLVQIIEEPDKFHEKIECLVNMNLDGICMLFSISKPEVPFMLVVIYRGDLGKEKLPYQDQAQFPLSIIDAPRLRVLSVEASKLWDNFFGEEAEILSNMKLEAVQLKAQISNLEYQINRYDLELKDERIRSQQLEQNAAWKAMARHMVHDLRNAMLPLNSEIYLAKRRLADAPVEVASFLARLDMKRQNVTKRIENFSLRHVVMNLEEKSINDLLVELQSWCEEKQILFSGKRKKANISLDLSLLFDVLQELSYNSHHWRDRGLICKLDVKIITRVDKSQILQLEFSDNGPGIEELEKQSIFLPGMSKKEKGSGQGLSFVADAITQMNGSIKETGKKGQGAIFRISFPILLETQKP